MNNDFTSLRDQLTTIVATAEFNDTNLIRIRRHRTCFVLSTVDGSTITVSAQVMDVPRPWPSVHVDPADERRRGDGPDRDRRRRSRRLPTNSRRSAPSPSGSRFRPSSRSKLVDILKEGVGSLVDADLAKESATLQALQIQQQLGVQSLGDRQREPGHHSQSLPVARGQAPVEAAEKRPFAHARPRQNLSIDR